MKMLPGDLWATTRYYDVYEKTSVSLRGRLGFSNDYIVGFSHPWDTGGVWTTSNYQSFLNIAKNALVEGEMPWGGQLPGNMKNLDGWGVTGYLHTAHFSVLSCHHNNREGGMIYDMKLWRDVTITPAALKVRNLPFYNAWFYDANGKTVTRSLFDYIQDHLGYLIQSSDMTVKKDGAKITSSFALNNYGFAAPLAMKQLRLVLLDESDKIVASQTVGGQLADLQTGTSKSFTVSLTSPNASKIYRIGLFLEAHNGRGAKLANDLPLVAGINVFGTIN